MNELESEEIYNSFSQEELKQYARHFSLDEIGIKGQLRLKNARVLVIGAGGLGCPALLYLAAAGVGHLGIVDGDVVEMSNLQRQILYTIHDIGKPKAIAAKERLEALNPSIHITAYPVAFSRENALLMVADYDIIADGTDNFPTRYLVNDACVLASKTNVYASVSRFEGQVAVFNAANEDGTRGPNYRDLFSTPPAPGTVLNCAEEGILGVLPGIIGSMQANEIIKLITGVGKSLNGKIALYDAATLSMQVIKIRSVTNVTVTELIDYELYCNQPPLQEVNKISPYQLQALIKAGAAIQLIDVRQPKEHQTYNIGGILIPLDDLKHAAHLVSREKKVILYCQSGSRSMHALAELKKQGNYDNVFSLEGGIAAWQKIQ